MTSQSLDSIYALIQIISAVLLIMAILLQQQSSSLSGAFGGGDSATYHTKRGAEKFLFSATIFLAVVFFAVSLARVLLG